MSKDNSGPSFQTRLLHRDGTRFEPIHIPKTGEVVGGFEINHNVSKLGDRVNEDGD